MSRGPVLCGSCPQRIRWVRTYAGRNMPLNFDPDPEGNVVLESTGARNGRYEVRALVLAGADLDLARTQERVLYMPHHATCPHAEQYRR